MSLSPSPILFPSFFACSCSSQFGPLGSISETDRQQQQQQQQTKVPHQPFCIFTPLSERASKFWRRENAFLPLMMVKTLAEKQHCSFFLFLSPADRSAAVRMTDLGRLGRVHTFFAYSKKNEGELIWTAELQFQSFPSLLFTLFFPLRYRRWDCCWLEEREREREEPIKKWQPSACQCAVWLVWVCGWNGFHWLLLLLLNCVQGCSCCCLVQQLQLTGWSVCSVATPATATGAGTLLELRFQKQHF